MVSASMTKDFFYKGKYFDTLEEMMEYVKKWPDEIFNCNWFYRWLDQRREEAEYNARGNPFLTNRDIYRLLAQSVEWALKDD